MTADNHKKAVEFRNKKRQEFLDGKLPEEFYFILKRWDCDVGRTPDEWGFKFPRMFPENLKKEPLSLDVREKLGEEKWNKN